MVLSKYKLSSLLLTFFAVLLTGCGDSSSDSSTSESSVPFIEPIEFSYVLDHALYEFDPESGESTLIVESDQNLSLTLDSDISDIRTLDEPLSPMPEFFVYLVNDSAGDQLWMYELETRHEHKLYTFDQIEIPPTVCELLPIKTVDYNLFSERNEAVIKDERHLNLVLSSTEACDDDATLSYHYMEIGDSYTDTYRIEVYEELNENSDNADCTDDCPTEIVTRAELVARPLIAAEEALVYAGSPLINNAMTEFGYIGLDSATNTLEFYEGNAETKVKTYSWSLHSDDFSAQVNEFRSSDSAIAYRTGNSLIVEKGFDLIEIDITSVFEDDLPAARTEALNNPVFRNDAELGFRYYHDPEQDQLFVLTSDQALQQAIRTGINKGSTDLIKDFSLESLKDVSALVSGAELVIHKTFQDDSIALTTVNTKSLIENTLLNKSTTNLNLNTVTEDKSVFINLDSYEGAFKTFRYVPNVGSPTTKFDYLETFFSNIYNYATMDWSKLTVIGEDINIEEDDIKIVSPTLYHFDSEDDNALGDVIGTISTEAYRILSARILSETMGMSYIDRSIDDNIIDVYYFNPSTPYVQVEDEDGNLVNTDTISEMIFMFSYSES